MKKLIKRSYKAIKNRGLIDKKTLDIEFVDKMYEEYKELKEECIRTNKTKMIEECIDFITVGIMFLHHNGYSFKKEFKKGIIKNEKRARNRNKSL